MSSRPERIQKNRNNISNPRRRNRVAVKDKKTGVSFSPTPVSLMVTSFQVVFLFVSGRGENRDRTGGIGRGRMIFSLKNLDDNFKMLTGEYVTPKGWGCLDATLFVYDEKPYLCFSNE